MDRSTRYPVLPGPGMSSATLSDVVTAARYALRFGGRFAMVPERLGEILVALHEHQMEVSGCGWFSQAGKASNMMLVEAVVGSSTRRAEGPAATDRT